MVIDTLCLSGGGIYGFNLIGCLKYLDESKIIILNKIKKIVGTSVGSLLGLLLIINYDINSIIKILYKLNFENIDLEYDIDNFIENYGFNNCSEILTIIQSLFFNKLNVYDLTFMELYKKTGKDFNVIVVNLTKKQEELLNYKNNPEMSVILALRMSISIPLMFYPVKYNNNLYIDGSVMNNFGFNYCDSKKTIGICVLTNLKDNPKNILEYVKHIYVILINNLSKKHLENPKCENILYLKNKDQSMMNFDKNIKFELIKNGYKQTKKKRRINFIALKVINNIFSNIFKVN